MSRPQTRTLIDDPLGGTVRLTVLPGGLRVLTETVPTMRSASVGVWVGVGARDEAPELAGVSHFLEHLLFKGTAKRTATEIAEAIEAVGGESNAYTARELTCFYARVLDDDLPMAVDVLGDAMCASLVTPADVEVERDVILEEIAASADEPSDVVHELFSRALFGDGALGRDIAGDPKTVRRLTRGQINDFYRQHYQAPNLTVCAAGGVDHGETVKLVQEAFRPLLGGTAVPRQRRHDESVLPEPRLLLVERHDTEQAHLVVGCRTFSRHDPRKDAFEVLNNVLGGGMSSRLFQSVREQRGLAYTVYSFTSYFADTGMFGVYAGSNPDRVRQVRELVLAELERVASEGITDEELSRGKGMSKGGMVLSMEDSGSRMNALGRAELLYGEHLSLERELSDIEAVTSEQIRSVAAEILSQPMTTAAVGPFDQKEFR
ncbi:M16 family metallopeptidase [Glycomyces albidus]|jgi:predicted Zn-dependent peptidase|uniref:Insulinase family protein n=1 Tax=Glycomyces albidus TaxID=2656774 RepID=A0A6L5GCF2_9ACTN|nr:pitrilysin family protein [Glycomyces albidus]MQM27203.1 insulinase family protein [Glycomyces albidus]